MFCPTCGRELDDSAAFCAGCGNKVPGSQSVAPSPAAPRATEAPTADAPRRKKDKKDKKDEKDGTLKGKPKKRKLKLIAVLVVLAALVIAGAVTYVTISNEATLGQSTETFRKAFEQKQPYRSSLPADRYTEDTAYKMSGFQMSDLKRISSNGVSATVVATLENDTYAATMQYDASFYDDSGNAVGTEGDYIFEFKSMELDAKRGITRDPERDLSNVESTLSEDGASCTVAQKDEYDFWFATSVVDRTYRYKMTDSGWAFDSEDESHSIAYKDIDGVYAAKNGDMLKLSNVSITDLDSETGTFSLACSIGGFTDGNSAYEPSKALAKATIDAQIDNKHASDEYRMEDGYCYYFEALGTTDKGAGNSLVKGYFAIGVDKSKIIQIVDGSLDTQTISARSPEDEPKNVTFDFKGTLFKQ